MLRQIIDEVMYEIRALSGQEYVDEYASKREPAAEPSGVVIDIRSAGTARADREAAESEIAAVNGASRNGASTNGHQPAPAEVAAVSAGRDFTEATQPPSSADVLARPRRRHV